MANRKWDLNVGSYAQIEKREKSVRRKYEQPNAETIAAIEEGEELLKSKAPGYKTIDELMKALGV